MTIGILYQNGVEEYDFGWGHPFRGDRFEVFVSFLKDRLIEGEHYRLIAAEPATDDDLLLVCTREYIDLATAFYRAAHLGLSYSGSLHKYLSGDNVPSSEPGKLEEAARLIVGQAKTASDLVLASQYTKMVSIGGGLHHAKPSYGEGFCIYNDVAFCARYLIEKHGLERVLVLDTDAHAGNGTCDFFYDDPRVLFIDIHQNPRTVYPGTGYAHQIGHGKGEGFTVNIPMPVGAGNESFKLAFETIIEPITNEFKPQIIIRNGGSDPHFLDQLTNLGVTVEGFRMIGERVRKMAEVCGGKVIDLLTSGYNLNVLPYAWLALICGLADLEVPIKEPYPGQQRHMEEKAGIATENVIDEVKYRLSRYWNCLK
jgi:acetoin utilization protein AcuC